MAAGFVSHSLDDERERSSAAGSSLAGATAVVFALSSSSDELDDLARDLFAGDFSDFDFFVFFEEESGFSLARSVEFDSDLSRDIIIKYKE